MNMTSFDAVCLSGRGTSEAIDKGIKYISMEDNYEENAEYISRISQQIILSDANEYWEPLLTLCDIGEVSIKTTKAKGFLYKAYINYYNYVGLSPKVVEYALKYGKLELEPIDNYEVYNMAAFSLFETGFYEKAIEYILMSQKAFDCDDVKTIFKVMSYNNLVYCYAAINDEKKVVETYRMFRELIDKEPQCEKLFTMCTLFVKLRIAKSNEDVIKSVMNGYLEYISQSRKKNNMGVMENEDVHIPFIDYSVKKGDLSQAADICKNLIQNPNICGSKKQIYRRLLTIYQLQGDNVPKQDYFDLVVEYNKILEDYNKKYDDIMHELVKEQFRISRIEDKFNEMKTTYKIDSLTACYNRKAFDIEIEKETDEKKAGTIIFIDLDYLKKVNDTYGHNNGDVYIRYFSYITSNVMDSKAKLYRYGGDEFIIISRAGYSEAASFIEKLKTAFKEPCRLIDENVYMQFSYGISSFDGVKIKIKDALLDADKKMYENKGKKRR